MSAKSKKKRNVGLLYEFLILKMSHSLVEGENKDSKRALHLMKKYFKPDSEIYKEFRLVNALHKTTVSSEAVAYNILQEAKLAARKRDRTKLEKEKSYLIDSINKSLQDPDFYDRHVDDYKILSTIHTLFEDWRSSEPDLRRLAQYEDEVVKWLLKDKSSKVQTISENSLSTNTARALMHVITRKLNEKYSNVLTPEQKDLLRTYAFSEANSNSEKIREKLTQIKTNLLENIDSRAQNLDNLVTEKLKTFKEQLVLEQFDIIDDQTIARVMLYLQLDNELSGGKSE
jgi:hypothetical protein